MTVLKEPAVILEVNDEDETALVGFLNGDQQWCSWAELDKIEDDDGPTAEVVEAILATHPPGCDCRTHGRTPSNGESSGTPKRTRPSRLWRFLVKLNGSTR